jgi:hypothetical protein
MHFIDFGFFSFTYLFEVSILVWGLYFALPPN